MNLVKKRNWLLMLACVLCLSVGSAAGSTNMHTNSAVLIDHGATSDQPLNIDYQTWQYRDDLVVMNYALTMPGIPGVYNGKLEIESNGSKVRTLLTPVGALPDWIWGEMAAPTSKITDSSLNAVEYYWTQISPKKIQM